MAITENQGAKIYWDEQGQGEPVLLIMGLSYSSDMWFRTRPVLAAQYRTIAFDNRGAGRSDVPPGPYSIALMASDAAAVLDAAGVDSAHILGVSMGGMIAQEFVIQYPHRVRSLVLGCTAPGGIHSIPAEASVNQTLMSRNSMTHEAAAEAIIPFIYDPGTPRARIEEDIAMLRPWIQRPEGFMAQLLGIVAWEGYSRLSRIQAPTLVIHGECDRLVPAGNAELLATRIPGAKLVMLPHASHIFVTDQPEPTHRALLAFLAEHSAGHRQVGA